MTLNAVDENHAQRAPRTDSHSIEEPPRRIFEYEFSGDLKIWRCLKYREGEAPAEPPGLRKRKDEAVRQEPHLPSILTQARPHAATSRENHPLPMMRFRNTSTAGTATPVGEQSPANITMPPTADLIAIVNMFIFVNRDGRSCLIQTLRQPGIHRSKTDHTKHKTTHHHQTRTFRL